MQPEQMLEVRRELARAIADAADRKGLGSGIKPGSGSAPGLGLGGGSAGGGASSDGSSCSTAGAQGRSLAALLVLPLAGLVSRRRRS